jgi:hypothetical protein
MHKEGVLQIHDGRTIWFARGKIAKSQEGIGMFILAKIGHGA